MLSAQGVSSSLLSTGRHGRFEWYSYCDKQRKYSATTKLHCNLQKETRGSGFCWRRVPVQEDKQERRLYVDYGATADIPQSSVKQYRDLIALK